MKIAITGHTAGFGKECYDYFLSQGHEVLGISRTTGFDIVTDKGKIVNAVAGYDVFINNANIDQLDLLHSLLNKVDKIIVIGTAMQFYKEYMTFEYLEEKAKLWNACKLATVNPTVTTKILHIGISFLPKNLIGDGMLSDNCVTYPDIMKSLDFWIDNPTLMEMSFAWKFTKIVEEQLKKIEPNLSVNFL